eukprot:CAMPEP_0196592784 /NCGR_PEP_ID=MMETSP1081-20130531/73787_1 /TAXON_ID=36882 /ORGANISM="Pyramimonas amylifera, Strain CCMP720" /LENGTH=296 /DNA_ID=CAMNT_0041916573 /DNA_START=254 /DNA_END=1144 /DNA_ORIENTATION=+
MRLNECRADIRHSTFTKSRRKKRFAHIKSSNFKFNSFNSRLSATWREHQEPSYKNNKNSTKNNKSDQNDENVWQRLISSILEQGIDGTGVTESAKSLGNDYINNTRYATVEDKVHALVRMEAAKSFLAGFISGVGGMWTLPIAVPVAVYANWVLQARVAGAVAHLYGHDLSSLRIRTLCLLCLLGDSAWGVLKTMGVRVMEKATHRAILRIPTVALVKINKAVGTKLIVKCGEGGAIKLQRAVPIIGGVVAGGFDASACLLVGEVASKMFKPENMEEIKNLIDWDGVIDVDDYSIH